jgi:ADP-heptose:LPS heptosyltransferase
LWQQHGWTSVVVWSGPREQVWASDIVRDSPECSVLAPRTDLVELAALLRKAALFVGSDTGPLHLAAAVGTPCVAMYGPSRPAKCGPFGDGHAIVQAYYQSGSGRQRRRAANLAMQAIHAEQVCAACDQIIRRHLSRAARQQHVA